MLKVATISALVIAITACAPSDVTRAQDAVKITVTDPISAQFKDVVAYDGGIVCGKFNSKNSQGGYGEFKDFAYDGAALAETTDKITGLCQEKDKKLSKAERIQKASAYVKSKEDNTSKDMGLKELAEVLGRYGEATSAAALVTRGEAPTHLAKLKSIKKEFDSIIIHNCSKELKSVLGESMELTIKTFVDQLEWRESDAIISSKLASSKLKQGLELFNSAYICVKS
jgi:hypothetical protein